MDPFHLSPNFVIKNLPSKTKTLECDLVIVGSGPVAMTYARLAIESNAPKTVVMLECGGIDSSPPGSHKKNAVVYQKDIDLFTGVITAALEPASVAVDPRYFATVPPDSWNSNVPFRQKGQNPNQNAAYNLGAAAVARSVGGMATHWTCAVPRFTGTQLPNFKDFNDSKWDTLYSKAENYIGKNKDEDLESTNNPFGCSVRNYIVYAALNAYKTRKQLPLAVGTNPQAPSYLTWSSPYTVISPVLHQQNVNVPTDVTLYTNALAVKLNKAPDNKKIESVSVKNLIDLTAQEIVIKAKCVVVAAGAILGPQLLVNSQLAPHDGENPKSFDMPNVGKYLTEQTIAFCQIIFRQDIIDSLQGQFIMPKDMWGVTSDNKWPKWLQDKVKEYHTSHKKDPIPIPLEDRDPQITIPYATDHPWHTQIHRDAFSYGALAPTIDTRLVVDLRFFGEADPRMDNTLTFEKEIEDGYGMPQPTFHYSLRDPSDVKARENNGIMAQQMNDVAAKLGGFLPGSAPQFMTPGLALHIGGTIRAGDDEATSVVNSNLRVWKFHNLYLAGNGVIPTAFAANPTLTSIALAINSFDDIKKLF